MQIDSLVFQKATKLDLPRVLELYVHFETDKSKVMSLAKAEAMFEKMQSYPNYSIYLVKQNEDIIASFTLLIMDNIVHEGTPSAIIDSVIVDPQHQNKGIGKRMMLEAMKLSADSGCYKLALSSNLKWGVQDFYAKLGFKQHGVSLHVDLV